MKPASRLPLIILVMMLPALAAELVAATADPDTSAMSPAALFAWKARQGLLAEENKAASPLPEGVTRLTTTSTHEKHACWSPDGQHVYYASHGSGPPQILRMDIATLASEAITEGPFSHEMPDLSPNGEHLAMRTNRSGDVSIWVIRLADGASAKLTGQRGLPVREHEPRWSPTGMEIFYEQSMPGWPGSKPMVVRRDGQNRRHLTDAPGTWTQPCPMPDGKRSVWIHRLGIDSEIVFINNEVTALTETKRAEGVQIGSYDYMPARGVFVVSYLRESDPERGFDLGIWNPKTGQVELLLDLGRNEINPVLSPDGSRLLFQADHEGQSELYVYLLP